MIADVARYVVTVGPVTVTVCSGIFGLIRLKMRLKFNRYVIDRAADQGQPVDAVTIIELTTPRASLRRSRGDREITEVADDGPDVDFITDHQGVIPANVVAGVRPLES